MTTPFQTAAASVQAGADAHDEAARLVGQMTVEEKLDCLDGDNPFWPGRTDMMSGGYYLHPWPAAAVERTEGQVFAASRLLHAPGPLSRRRPGTTDKDRSTVT